ncbi:hypothetical protein AAY473_036520 [Plecturocebus cupreus]
MSVSFCYGKDGSRSFGIGRPEGGGQLIRRRLFSSRDWRARGRHGRDSSLGARSVTGVGGAAGVSWSKCPRRRCQLHPSLSRRLQPKTIQQGFCFQGPKVCYPR